MADDTQPILVAVVADTHINSTVGLCPPVVPMDDGGSYHASKVQRAIWAAWKEFWSEDVYARAKNLGAKVYVVINGDLNDLNVHDGTQLISHSEADIVKTSVDAIEPAIDGADYVFIVRGTEAHVGKKANLEEEVAKDVGAEPDKCAGTHSWYWLKLEAAGVTFDIAHHPETFARRPWTKDAAAVRHGRIVREQYLDRGERPPDVALRAHIHEFVPGNRRLPPFFCYCPGWQVMTSFSYRLGSTAVKPVGGLVFVCRDGDFEFMPVIRPPMGSKRRPWRES